MGGFVQASAARRELRRFSKARCNNDRVVFFLNSKIGRIARWFFSERGRRKMNLGLPAPGRAPTAMDLTSAADSVEGFFPAQANSATAILFSWSHWRSWPIDTD
jgi:hypothetical protein